MRSRRRARSRLCVAISAARPLSRTISIRLATTCSPVVWSRLPVGSSASRTLRVVGERAHDRDALLLAARQSRRPVAEALGKPDPAQQHLGLAPGGGARHRGDHLRQHHVFERRKLGQQVMELIDETERAAAQRCALLVGQAAAVAPLDQHRPLCWLLQEPGDVQQRRFPGPGRPDQRDDLARPQRQVHPVQHRERNAALPEHLSYAAQFEHRRRAG